MASPDSVEVIKASYDLQKRVGKGPIAPTLLEKCHEVMNTNTTDFAPIAREFLEKLERAIAVCADPDIDMREKVEGLSRPVMELKASAKMFRYELVTSLANVMLGFLEAMQNLDRDAVEIVAAHHRTLAAIIDRKMNGDGGPYGQLLVQELKDACNRYFHKRGMRLMGAGTA